MGINIKISVDQERKQALALDFGICEMAEEQLNNKRTTFAINFCLFFSFTAVVTTLAYLM